MREINPFEFPRYDLERDEAYFGAIVASPDVDLRNTFLRYLATGCTYGPGVKKWAARLVKDPDYSVKIGVMDLLRKRDRRLFLESLEGLVADRSPFVKRHVLRSIVGLDEDLVVEHFVALASDDEPTVRELAAERLASFRSEVALALLDPLCQDRDRGVRVTAIRSALGLGGRTAERIVLDLEAGNAHDRRCLAEAMSGGQGVWPDVLRRLCLDEEVEVRQAAAKAVFDRQMDVLFDTMASLRDDPDPKVKILVAGFMGKNGSLEAEGILSEMIRDDDPKVKEAVADAMVMLGMVY